MKRSQPVVKGIEVVSHDLRKSEAPFELNLELHYGGGCTGSNNRHQSPNHSHGFGLRRMLPLVAELVNRPKRLVGIITDLKRLNVP
ncbi:hypothetical protein U1Q18_049799, partial [Sarracenia purpurea var. burkii]